MTCANKIVVTTTITIIIINLMRTYRHPTHLLHSTEDKAVFHKMVQANQYTTTITSREHRIIITTIMDLEVDRKVRYLQQRFQSRSMTFSPSLTKLPSSLVGTWVHNYMKRLQSYPNQIRHWTISSVTLPNRNDCLALKPTPSTALSPSECLDSF